MPPEADAAGGFSLTQWSIHCLEMVKLPPPYRHDRRSSFLSISRDQAVNELQQTGELSVTLERLFHLQSQFELALMAPVAVPSH